MLQHAALGDTVFFYFAVNDTAGSGDSSGAGAFVAVREAGSGPTAPPVATLTPQLITNGSFPNGCYEVAVNTSGYDADTTYALFCSLAVDSQNPTGFIGMLRFVQRYTQISLGDFNAGYTGLQINGSTAQPMINIRNNGSGPAVQMHTSNATTGFGINYTGIATPTIDDAGGEYSAELLANAPGGGGGTDVNVISMAGFALDLAGPLGFNFNSFFANNDSASGKVQDDVGGSTFQLPQSFVAVSQTGTTATIVSGSYVDTQEPQGTAFELTGLNTGIAQLNFAIGSGNDPFEVNVEVALSTAGSRTALWEIWNDSNTVWDLLGTVENTGGLPILLNSRAVSSEHADASGNVQMRFRSTDLRVQDNLDWYYANVYALTELGSVPTPTEIAIATDVQLSGTHGVKRWEGMWIDNLDDEEIVITEVTTQSQFKINVPNAEGLTPFIIRIDDSTTLDTHEYKTIESITDDGNATTSTVILREAATNFALEPGDRVLFSLATPYVDVAFWQGVDIYDGTKMIENAATTPRWTGEALKVITDHGGAGPWTTATGFATPGDLSGLALEASVQQVLSTGGAGPWQTATGFATPGDLSALALEASVQQVLSTGGAGPWQTATGFATPGDLSALALEASVQQVLTTGGAGPWQTATGFATPGDLSALALEASVQQVLTTGGPGPWKTLDVNEILNLAIESGAIDVNLGQALRVILAAVSGKSIGAGTNRIRYRDTNDAKDRIDATTNVSGERTSITLDMD